jgi:hypothetical protein
MRHARFEVADAGFRIGLVFFLEGCLLVECAQFTVDVVE